MNSVDEIIKRAWLQIVPYPNSKLRLTDLLALFNALEDITNNRLLTNEYRDFLVEFILECPDAQVDQQQFKSLMERLFEISIESVINGELVDRSKSNKFNLYDGKQSNPNNNDEFTQTMNLESQRFNSFMQSDSVENKRNILKQRIDEVESLLSNFELRGIKDERMITKMKELLLGYYKNLTLLEKNNNLNQSSMRKNNLESILQRLKSDVDKQDMLIVELKRKVGHDNPKGIFDIISFKINKIYLWIIKILKFPFYFCLLIIVLNCLSYFVFNDDYTDIYETENNEAYWGNNIN